MSTEIGFRTWLRYPGTKLLLVLILFLAAEVVILLRHTSRSASTLVAREVLQVGQKILDLQATDLDQTARKIDLSVADKLLFVLSTTCAACERNFANWKEIEQSVGREQVLYLSSDPVSDSAKRYAADKEIADRLMFFADVQEKAKFKVVAVPQTIYIRSGEVKAIHVGVLPPAQVESFKSMRIQGRM